MAERLWYYIKMAESPSVWKVTAHKGCCCVAALVFEVDTLQGQGLHAMADDPADSPYLEPSM